MRRPLLVILITLAVSLRLIGLDWMALQSVAWAGMFISRSINTSVEMALATTFDGDHPCQLCNVVQEGVKKEREQAPVKTEALAKVKIDGLPSAVTPFSQQIDCSDLVWPHVDAAFVVRSSEPLTPPPRRA